MILWLLTSIKKLLKIGMVDSVQSTTEELSVVEPLHDVVIEGCLTEHTLTENDAPTSPDNTDIPPSSITKNTTHSSNNTIDKNLGAYIHTAKRYNERFGKVLRRHQYDYLMRMVKECKTTPMRRCNGKVVHMIRYNNDLVGLCVKNGVIVTVINPKPCDGKMFIKTKKHKRKSAKRVGYGNV
jgi:hypothetical protein